MEAGPTAYQEDTIDLRQHMHVLARRWWVIVLGLVLAAGSAFLASTLQAPTYEATALVVVGEPRYVLNFAPRMQDSPKVTIRAGALVTLATSDEVLAQVLDKVGDALTESRRELSTLRAMVTAQSGRDPSLLKLVVRGTNPKLVASIANHWADAFVVSTNRVYGVSAEDVRFFEAQVAQAKEKLDQAEQALVAYQGQNELPVLEARYGSLRSLQAQYLAEQRRIEGLFQDIATLHAQLGARPSAEPPAFDDQLAVLGLSLKSLNAQPSTLVQLQVTDTSRLTGRTVSEALNYLNTLEKNLRVKYADLDTRLVELGPALQHLQERMERLRSRQNRLQQARDVARETYVTVVRKLEESRIASEDGASRARVASAASVPTRPVAPPTLRSTVVGGVVGLILGLVAAFLLEYLETKPQAYTSRDEASLSKGARSVET